MSDIELVIKRCKRLESLLSKHFAAEGRGLHEKISRLEGRLPLPLVKRLRFIATVRNKLVHEEGVDQVDDLDAYVQACDDAEAALEKLAAPSHGQGRSFIGAFLSIWQGPPQSSAPSAKPRRKSGCLKKMLQGIALVLFLIGVLAIVLAYIGSLRLSGRI